ncbi:hypothetical protein CBI70_22840, partial [Salmonella enterica]
PSAILILLAVVWLCTGHQMQTDYTTAKNWIPDLWHWDTLFYTSPGPRDRLLSPLPASFFKKKKKKRKKKRKGKEKEISRGGKKKDGRGMEGV